MSAQKLSVLLVALLLRAVSGRAQTATPGPAPAPSADYQQVSVPVPRAVSLVSDVASVLFSRDAEGKDKVQALLDRRKARSEKRDQSLRFTIPKNGLTRTLGLVD